MITAGLHPGRSGRPQRDENVQENYRRMAEAIGVSCDSFVRSVQTHTTNVHRVTLENKRETLHDVDGLITN